jgi:hypothetical protein
MPIEELVAVNVALEILAKYQAGVMSEEQRTESLRQLRQSRNHAHRTFNKVIGAVQSIQVKPHYERVGTYSIDAGVALLLSDEEFLFVADHKISIIPSLRLQTFLEKGLQCSVPDCGLVGSFFAVERSWPGKNRPKFPPRFHLNLYAIDPTGKEILFTHDHTLARSLGGSDTLDNTTTMCAPHNSAKSVLESLIRQAQKVKVAKGE